MAFSAYYHNTGDHPVAVTILPTIKCRLTDNDRTIEIDAHQLPSAVAGTQSIHSQGFVKVQYEIRLPDNILGAVHLMVPQLQNAGFYFEIKESLQTQDVAGSWRSSDVEQWNH